MVNRKNLLASASAVAYLMSHTAVFASVSVPEIGDVPHVRSATEISVGRDPLMGLLNSVGGVLTIENVGEALRAGYRSLSPTDALQFPKLVASIRDLGVSDDVVDAAADEMLSLLSGPALSGDSSLASGIAAEIALVLGGRGITQVAQLTCSPREVIAGCGRDGPTGSAGAGTY